MAFVSCYFVLSHGFLAIKLRESALLDRIESCIQQIFALLVRYLEREGEREGDWIGVFG